MNETDTRVAGPRRPIALLWGALIALLLVPAVAMRVTDEVDWGPGDFVFAAALLGMFGIAVELAMRSRGRPLVRVGVVTASLALVLTIWAEAAVGIF